VRGADGADAALDARAAVVALPLGVLQARAGEPGAVRLDPEPAGKRDALAGLAMGDARRVVLHFAERWWERDALRAAGVGEHPADMGFLRLPDAAIPIWWTSAPLREPVLTGWLGGPRASRAAGLPDDALRDLALDALAAGLRLPRGELAAGLRGAYGHDWATDPLARGAYSYALVGAGEARRRLAGPVAGTLFWAGEATADAGAAGTVHGALGSGYRAAGEVLAALGAAGSGGGPGAVAPVRRGT
jgi:monoamine oxidase